MNVESNDGVPRIESTALQSILGSGQPSQFFDTVWQHSCAVFRYNDSLDSAKTEPCNDPFRSLIRNGLESLTELLERARERSEQIENNPDDNGAGQLPLLFKNQRPLSPSERAMYNNNLFAAFLDGTSVILNHADLLSPRIASLCEDLQKSFPHVYANTYWTPPRAQAVPPHADDRDVLIIQVYGRKEWRVYKNIPIPYPYPPEQVGKAGLEVPSQILNGPLLFQQTLNAGDVLYMPRGYVHEARASTGASSFHVTLALATHDWSLAHVLQSTTEEILMGSLEYRRAMPRDFGCMEFDRIDGTVKARVQSQLEEVVARLQEKLSVESIHRTLQEKYLMHNRRAATVRDVLIRELLLTTHEKKNTNLILDVPSVVGTVGRDAALIIQLDTFIRAATPDEKASIPPPLATEPSRGLHVREESFEGIMHVLQHLKENSDKKFRVRDLKSSLPDSIPAETICDLTMCCFARQCVELGALALA